MGFRVRRRRARPCRGLAPSRNPGPVHADHRRALRLPDEALGHRRHVVPRRRVVPAYGAHPRGLARTPRAAAFRGRGLRGAGLPQRPRPGQPQRRPDLVFLRRDRRPRPRRQRARRPRVGPLHRPLAASRQAVLEGEIRVDLLHPHHGPLAAGLDRGHGRRPCRGAAHRSRRGFGPGHRGDHGERGPRGPAAARERPLQGQRGSRERSALSGNSRHGRPHPARAEALEPGAAEPLRPDPRVVVGKRRPRPGGDLLRPAQDRDPRRPRLPEQRALLPAPRPRPGLLAREHAHPALGGSHRARHPPHQGPRLQRSAQAPEGGGPPLALRRRPYGAPRLGRDGERLRLHRRVRGAARRTSGPR